MNKLNRKIPTNTSGGAELNIRIIQDKLDEIIEWINSHYHFPNRLIEEDTINSETSHNNDFKKPCPECEGKGYVLDDSELDTKNRYKKEECPVCKGQGFIKS